MEANPALPTTTNGKSKSVNSSSAQPLISPSQIASMFNYPATLLPHWRATLAKVKTGSANAKLLCIGDSTTFGVYSNGSSTGNQKPNAWPSQLAGLFNSAGINAHANSFLASGGGATGGTSQTNILEDSRVSSTGWAALANALQFIGGTPYAASGTAAQTFTPTVPTDTCKVYYYQTGGGGTISTQINGGSATNQSTNGAASVASVTLSTTLGMNAYTVNWVNSTSVNPIILGFEAWDSSKSWVSVINAGWPVSRSSDWSYGAAVAYNPGQNGITGFAPDLSVIDLGINDIGNGNSVNFYLSNLQVIVNKCKITGDVVLVSPNPTITLDNTLNYPYAEQSAYQSALAQFANQNNIAFYDKMGRWGGGASYPVNNANGMMGEGLHPNAVGYADIASGLFNFIGNI